MKLIKPSLTTLILIIVLSASYIQHAQASDDIFVQRNRLEQNGHEWISMGFTFDAFIAPLESLNGCGRCEESIKEKMNKVVSARKNFGLDSISKAKSLGANTIRLQISQPGLDPQSQIYSYEYKINLENAIRTIRNAGLVVMLSMTHGEWSGLEGQGGFPNDSTFRSWTALRTIISGDQGVILEIYNEPNGPKGWEKWKSSHQELINRLRKELGFKNIFVINGLKAGRDYREAPQLFDPLNQMAYGVHPYLGGISKNDDEPEWREKWGWIKNNKPLIVTEWNVLGIWSVCDKDMGDRSEKLIKFILQNNLGLIGWAFDIEGSIFDSNGIPTNFDNITCGQSSKNGAGKLILRAISDRK